MTNQIVPNKPISKMTKLEVVRFINSLAPLLNHYSRSTRGSRVIAENLYQQYLNGQAMPVRKSIIN
jgi:hypothetical protein